MNFIEILLTTVGLLCNPVTIDEITSVNTNKNSERRSLRRITVTSVAARNEVKNAQGWVI